MLKGYQASTLPPPPTLHEVGKDKHELTNVNGLLTHFLLLFVLKSNSDFEDGNQLVAHYHILM